MKLKKLFKTASSASSVSSNDEERSGLGSSKKKGKHKSSSLSFSIDNEPLNSHSISGSYSNFSDDDFDDVTEQFKNDSAASFDLNVSSSSSKSRDLIAEAFARRVSDLRSKKTLTAKIKAKRNRGTSSVTRVDDSSLRRHASDVMSVTSSVMTPRTSNIQGPGMLISGGRGGGDARSTCTSIREDNVVDNGNVMYKTSSDGNNRKWKEEKQVQQQKIPQQNIAALSKHLVNAQWEQASQILHCLPLSNGDDGANCNGDDNQHPGNVLPISLLFASLSHPNRSPPSPLLKHLLSHTRPDSLERAIDASGDTPLHLLCRNPYSSYECIHAVLCARPEASRTANGKGDLPLHDYVRTTLRGGNQDHVRPHVGSLLWAMLCVLRNDQDAAGREGADGIGYPLHLAVRYMCRTFDRIEGARMSESFGDGRDNEKKTKEEEQNDLIARDKVSSVIYDLCAVRPEVAALPMSEKLVLNGGEDSVEQETLDSYYGTTHGFPIPHEFFVDHFLSRRQMEGLGRHTSELYCLRADVLEAFSPLPSASSNKIRTQNRTRRWVSSLLVAGRTANPAGKFTTRGRTFDVALKMYQRICRTEWGGSNDTVYDYQSNVNNYNYGWIKDLGRGDIHRLVATGNCMPHYRHFHAGLTVVAGDNMRISVGGPSATLRKSFLWMERYGLMPCTVDIGFGNIYEQGKVLKYNNNRDMLVCTVVDYGVAGKGGKEGKEGKEERVFGTKKHKDSGNTFINSCTPLTAKLIHHENDYVREIMCYSRLMHLQNSQVAATLRSNRPAAGKPLSDNLKESLNLNILALVDQVADMLPFDAYLDLFGERSVRMEKARSFDSPKKKHGYSSKILSTKKQSNHQHPPLAQTPSDTSAPSEYVDLPILNHAILLTPYQHNLVYMMGNGSLQTMGRNFDYIDNVRSILVDVANGLRNLHEAGFIHGNLNPQNVVCVSQNRFAIFNLECSHRFKASTSSSSNGHVATLLTNEKIETVKQGTNTSGNLDYMDVESLGCTGIFPPEIITRLNNPNEIDDISSIDARLFMTLYQNKQSSDMNKCRTKILYHEDGYAYMLRVQSKHIDDQNLFALTNPLCADPCFDIWSFGVLAYHLCNNVRQSLFPVDVTYNLTDARSHQQLYEWDRYACASKVYRNVDDPLAADMLQTILLKKAERPKSISQVLLHPFFDPKSRSNRAIMQKYADRHRHHLSRLHAQDEMEMHSRADTIQMKIQYEKRLMQIEEEAIALRNATLEKARAEMARILTWMSPTVQATLFFCPYKICKFLDKDVKMDAPLSAVVLPNVPDLGHVEKLMKGVQAAFTTMQDCAALFGVIHTKRKSMGEDIFDETVRSMWEQNIVVVSNTNKNESVDDAVISTFLDLIGLSATSRSHALNLIVNSGKTLTGDYQVVEVDNGEDRSQRDKTGEFHREKRASAALLAASENIKQLSSFFSDPLRSSAKIAMSSVRDWFAFFNKNASQLYLFDDYRQAAHIQPSQVIKMNRNPSIVATNNDTISSSFPHIIPTTPEEFSRWAPTLMFGRRPSIYLRRLNTELLEKYEKQYFQSRLAELAVVKASLDTLSFPGINEEYFWRELWEIIQGTRQFDIAPLQLVYQLVDRNFDGLNPIIGPENCVLWTTEDGLYSIHKESEPTNFDIDQR